MKIVALQLKDLIRLNTMEKSIWRPLHVCIVLYCPKINPSQTGKKQQQLQNKIESSQNYGISMLSERMMSLKYFRKLQLYKSRGLPSRKVPMY